MDWLIPFRPLDLGPALDPGLPRQVLRHLIRAGRLVMGAKVLDAGCGAGDLTRFLEDLSMEAAGIDESSAQIAAAAARSPHQRYSCCHASGSVPFPPHSFHAIFARDMTEYRRDLAAREALRATAHLLATLQPGGTLVLVERLEPDWSNQPGGHLETCFARHLGWFPGDCQTTWLADSLTAATTWKWMVGRQPRAGFVTAALTIPETARSLAEWEQLADEAARRGSESCCEWAAQDAPARTAYRSAA